MLIKNMFLPIFGAIRNYAIGERWCDIVNRFLKTEQKIEFGNLFSCSVIIVFSNGVSPRLFCLLIIVTACIMIFFFCRIINFKVGLFGFEGVLYQVNRNVKMAQFCQKIMWPEIATKKLNFRIYSACMENLRLPKLSYIFT